MFKRNSARDECLLTAGRHCCGAAVSLLAALSLSASCAMAQSVAPTAPTAPAAKAASASSAVAKKSNSAAHSSKPAWQDLTPVQQLSLQPLAANWNSLRESQKRKWLAVALNYPKLPPQEQEKLHNRMTDWASLSEQQRAQARLNFAESKQLSPGEKTATWQAYQELSPEERQKLATSAAPKPGGAAAVAKPIPPQKLAVKPVIQETPKAAPKMTASNHAPNHNTLLPPAPPALESAPSQKN